MNDIFNDNVSLKTETPAIAKHVLPAVPSSEVYLEDCVTALKRYNDNHFDLAIVALEVKEPSDDEIEQVLNKFAIHWDDEKTYNSIEVFIPQLRSLFSPQDCKKKEDWISVKDRPLITKDEKGNWVCTEDGDSEFIGALEVMETKEENGKDVDKLYWWIRHCVIEDGIGLCVVGDDCNEPSGWEIESITHWQPLPQPPTQAKEINT